MAVRSSTTTGFPGGNYVVELGTHDAALPGEYLIENGQAVVSVVAGQIGNLTLAATGNVVVAASTAPTIASPSLNAAGNIAITASLNRAIGDPALSAAPDAIVSGALTTTIDDVTLSAAGQVIVSGALAATLDEVALAATGHVPRRTGDVGVPWWWHLYVSRIRADQAAAREAKARTGDVVAVAPAPSATAEGDHVFPRIGEVAAIVPSPSASAALTTRPVDDEAALFAAFELVTLAPLRIVSIIEHPKPPDDDALIATATLVLAA